MREKEQLVVFIVRLPDGTERLAKDVAELERIVKEVGDCEFTCSIKPQDWLSLPVQQKRAS